MSRDLRKRPGSSTAAVNAKRRELADTGDAHEAPASIGRSDHPPYVGVDRQNGGKHGGPGGNQTLHGSRQTRDAVARLQRLPDEVGAEGWWQSDTEYHGQAADLVLQRDSLTDQLFPSDNQRPDSVCWQGLHMHRFEEAGSGEMRQAACIVVIGLVRR